MNEENEWDHMVKTDVVEGPVEKVARNKIVEAIQRMKSGKATGPSEVSVEMIVASGEIGVKVMMELCQRVMDGKEMLDEWKTSVIVPIFKEKGDVMICGSYRGMKLIEHAMKIVERVLERRIRTLVNLNEMQFGFMPGKRTVDAIFIVRRMQKEYQEKEKKLYSFTWLTRTLLSRISVNSDHEREKKWKNIPRLRKKMFENFKNVWPKIGRFLQCGL